jgi:hypothetical protein
MSTRVGTALVMLAVAVVLGVAIGPASTAAQDKAPPRDKATPRAKWEYKVVRINVPAGAVGPGVIAEADLAALGEQGWDLVAILGGQPVNSGAAGVVYADTVYYFKRPK